MTGESDVHCDHRQLLELPAMRMPFGRYAGRRLVDLPEPYLVWFARQGFPPGRLGEMLQTVHVVKVNGLEYLFEPLPGSEAVKAKKRGSRPTGVSG